MKTLSVDEVPAMLVADLRSELSARGLSSEGKKAELVSRLEDFLKSDTKDAVDAPKTEEEGKETSANTTEKVEENQATSTQEVTPATRETADVDEASAKRERLKATLNKKRAHQQASAQGAETCNVRVDHFQRPLNIKGLLSWLNEQLSAPSSAADVSEAESAAISTITESPLEENHIWINSIKTHAYVTLPSVEVARHFISRISGQRYPSTSTATLVVNFTTVSASEAESSTEATMRPGDWMSSIANAADAPVEEEPPVKRRVETSDVTDAKTQEAKRKDGGCRLEAERTTVAQPPLVWAPVDKDIAARRLNEKRQHHQGRRGGRR